MPKMLILHVRQFFPSSGYVVAAIQPYSKAHSCIILSVYTTTTVVCAHVILCF